MQPLPDYQDGAEKVMKFKCESDRIEHKSHSTLCDYKELGDNEKYCFKKNIYSTIRYNFLGNNINNLYINQFVLDSCAENRYASLLN